MHISAPRGHTSPGEEIPSQSVTVVGIELAQRLKGDLHLRDREISFAEDLGPANWGRVRGFPVTAAHKSGQAKSPLLGEENAGPKSVHNILVHFSKPSSPRIGP
jgi:hypothetical protein